jgi:type III secretory pathway component EscR
MKLQSPKWLMAIGVGATLLLVLAVVLLLALTVGQRAVSDNAALIAALVPLGGVFTAQMVSIALEDQRAREAHTLEDRRAREARTLEDQRAREARELETQRAHEAALQSYFEQVGELLMEKPLHRSSPGDSLSVIVRALTLTVLELPSIGLMVVEMVVPPNGSEPSLPESASSP